MRAELAHFQHPTTLLFSTEEQSHMWSEVAKAGGYSKYQKQYTADVANCLF